MRRSSTDHATLLFMVAALFAMVPVTLLTVGVSWLLARPWALLSGESTPCWPACDPAEEA